jgi:hypothetical protein
LLVSGESAEPETTSTEPPASSRSPAEVLAARERISEDTSRMGRMSFENTAPMEDVSELRALAQRMTPSYGEAPGPIEAPPSPALFSSKTTMPMFGNGGAKRAEAAPHSSRESRASEESRESVPPASTPAVVPPAPDSNPSTGARNSTSILFSLAALAEKERSQVVTIGPRSEKELAAVPSIHGESDDHSGLIDLHRLMPSGSKLSVQLVKPVSSSEPPLAVTVTRDVSKPAPRPGRVMLFAVLSIFLVVGVALGMRSALKWAATKDASRLTAAAQAAAVESPPIAPRDETPKLDSLVPPPAPASEVTASSTEAPANKAAKSKSRRHHHSRRSKAAPAPAEAPAPSNDPCHCNGDLACAMRCASRN